MNDPTILALAVTLALVLGLIAGLAVWLRSRTRFEAHERRLREAHESEVRSLREELAALRQARDSDQEKLAWSEQAEERLREAFTALAGETLRRNADSFSSRAKEDLKGVLTPFQDKLLSLDGQEPTSR